MKKLLLALVLLAGSILPSMAQNYGDRNKSKDSLLETNAISLAVERGARDFLVYKSFESDTMQTLNLLLKNAKEDDWKAIDDDTIQTVINLSVTHMHDISFVKFLIDNGMPLSEYNRYIKSTKIRMQEANDIMGMLTSDFAYYYGEDLKIGEDILTLFMDNVVEKTALDFFKNEDYDSEYMNLLKNMLKDSENWKFISDSMIGNLVTLSAPFIEFLVDNLGMPESEINRYLTIAQEKKDEISRTFKEMGSVEAEEAFSIREYETCEDVLELLNQVKKEKMYEKMSEVDANIDRILRENREKKMQQLEQEYNQRYNQIYSY